MKTENKTQSRLTEGAKPQEAFRCRMDSWSSRKYLRLHALDSPVARAAYRLAVEAAWASRPRTITPERLSLADARCRGRTLSPQDWLWLVEERVRARRPGIQLSLFA